MEEAFFLGHEMRCLQCLFFRYIFYIQHSLTLTPKLCFLATGTIKGLTTNQLEVIGCQLTLGNAYNLELCPTSELSWKAP